MPKKPAAFSGPSGYSDAYQYLVSVGIAPPTKRAKSSQINHEKQVIREARKALANQEQGLAPSKEAGRGKHSGEKAKEKQALPVHRIQAEGWKRTQFLIFNEPVSDPTHEINAKDIAALFKAAGRPDLVTVIVSGTVKWDSPTKGQLQEREEEEEEEEDIPCEAKTLVAHTDRSTIDAVVKRKMSLFDFANDLLRYGPDKKKKTWCTIDYIGLYETAVPEERPGRQRKQVK